jgi:major membrane immunogen (membrane-anchored lipoprotein)
MKKINIIVILALVVLLGSCVTKRACDRKFPPQEYTTTQDSTYTKDSIVEKIVEVPVYIKGDTVTKSDTVFIDKETGLSNSKPIHAETTFSKATSQVRDGKLGLTLIQKDSMFKVQALAKEAYYWKEKYNSKELVVIKEVKFIPAYHKVMSIVGLILSVGFLAYIVFKVRAMLNP